MDYFSRYYEIEITKDITSEKLIDALEGMFCRNGLPVSISSDNGPQFKSEAFLKYLTENGIKHRAVTPLHPAANGEVERQNRSLMKRIRIAQAESKDWRKEIRKYLFAYRTTPHSTTGVSPAELMFRRTLRTKLPELEISENVFDEEAREQDAYAKHRNKMYVDEKRGAVECDLEPGDSVLVKKSVREKMDTPYHSEPYQLLQKNGNSCVVKSPDGVCYKRNSEFVKKYQEEDIQSDIPEVPSESEPVCVSSGQTADSSSNSMATSPKFEIGSRKSTRARKQPKRFEDFEM